MSQQRPIQISIPKPCSQPWEYMTPCERGRFCSKCQTPVIDLTEWTDDEVRSFFASHRGHVCVQARLSQLEQPYRIPHQPHSRLYVLTITLGLTLIFNYGDAQAQNRPPQSTLPATEIKAYKKHWDDTLQRTGTITKDDIKVMGTYEVSDPVNLAPTLYQSKRGRGLPPGPALRPIPDSIVQSIHIIQEKGKNEPNK